MLEETINILEKNNEDYEILVINDCSADQTTQVV